jgi:hypothetical protein
LKKYIKEKYFYQYFIISNTFLSVVKIQEIRVGNGWEQANVMSIGYLVAVFRNV